MSASAAILGILAALIPLAVVLTRRWLAHRDDPKRILEEAHRAVARGDQADVNRLLDDALRRSPVVRNGILDDRHRVPEPGPGDSGGQDRAAS